VVCARFFGEMSVGGGRGGGDLGMVQWLIGEGGVRLWWKLKQPVRSE